MILVQCGYDSKMGVSSRRKGDAVADNGKGHSIRRRESAMMQRDIKMNFVMRQHGYQSGIDREL